MRRGQQVEVILPGDFKWTQGFTHVRKDADLYVVKDNRAYSWGLLRLSKEKVRPITCKSCSGQQFHRCRTGDKLCLHCSACGEMTSKDPRKLRRNDAYSPFPVDQDQLRVGTAMEAREHGMSRAQAEKTAREHLAEDDQYYTKIAKMEKGSPMWGWDKLFTF